MATTSNIKLPISFSQLVDLIKTLPKKEKEILLDAMQQNESSAIPEWQKKEVRKRMKKYTRHPELLVSEKKALKLIKEM